MDSNIYPPPYDENDAVKRKLKNLKDLATKYELAGGSVKKLRLLEAYDIVVIADDSSSMKEPSLQTADSLYGIKTSRWDELRDRIFEMIDISVCLDRDGIDIYFLNGTIQKHITNNEEAKRLFDKAPNGYTPLSAVYSKILAKNTGGEKKMLIVIATDGEPNKKDEHGIWRKDIEGFIKLLTERENPKNTPTCIMACSDSPDEIAWLNRIDKTVPYLDVVESYVQELAQVRNIQGSNFVFSKGDYTVKTLIGPIDKLYDQLDQKKFTATELEIYLDRPLTDEERKGARSTSSKYLCCSCSR